MSNLNNYLVYRSFYKVIIIERKEEKGKIKLLFTRRLKRNLLVFSFRSGTIRFAEKRERERKRAFDRTTSTAALRMGLSLASATADGIMTRVPQMTRDAYLMAHLPTPPSYYCVFVRVALERVRAGGGEGGRRGADETGGEGGRGKTKEKRNKKVSVFARSRREEIKRPMTPSPADARDPPRLVTVEPRLD